MASNDFSEFCTCGGKREVVQPRVINRCDHVDVFHLHRKQIEVSTIVSVRYDSRVMPICFTFYKFVSCNDHLGVKVLLSRDEA